MLTYPVGFMGEQGGGPIVYTKALDFDGSWAVSNNVGTLTNLDWSQGFKVELRVRISNNTASQYMFNAGKAGQTGVVMYSYQHNLIFYLGHATHGFSVLFSGESLADYIDIPIIIEFDAAPLGNDNYNVTLTIADENGNQLRSMSDTGYMSQPQASDLVGYGLMDYITPPYLTAPIKIWAMKVYGPLNVLHWDFDCELEDALKLPELVHGDHLTQINGGSSVLYADI